MARGSFTPPPSAFGCQSAFAKIEAVKTSKSHEIRSNFGPWLIRNQQILGVYPLKTFTSDLLAPQHKKKPKWLPFCPKNGSQPRMPCLLYGFTPVNARPKHVTAAHCLQRIPLVALFQSLWGRQMSQNDGKNCVVNKIAFKKIPST